jgi:hypothetical protein
MKRRGQMCPVCSEKMHVKATSTRKGYRDGCVPGIQRVYICRACRHEKTTLEVDMSILKSMQYVEGDQNT